MAYFRKAKAKSSYLRPASAASPGVAANYLPPIEQDVKRAQLMEDIFIKANRSGARSKASTGYAIRPRGMRPSQMVEDLLAVKHNKKVQKPALSEELKEDPRAGQMRREIQESVGMILPRNFCPDCGATDKPHSRGVMNINRYDHDRYDLHIKKDSLLISFFCQECAEKQVRKQKNMDAEDALIMQTHQGEHTMGEINAASRLVRIKKHTEEFIKARLISGDTEIFPNGDPFR